MVLRLPTNRRLAKQIADALETEFDEAMAILRASADAGTAVHEVRKRLKKIRALWRLIRPSSNRAVDADARLRAIAHRLSSLRDADARIDTLRHLRAHYSRAVTAAVFQRVVVRFQRERRRIDRHVPRILDRSHRDLGKIRTTVLRDARRRRHPHRTANRMLEDYRKARNVVGRLSRDARAADFHALRRHVKRHAYQLHFFKGARARRRIAGLSRLEEWLGEEHDLVVLRTAMLARRPAAGGARGTALVLGLSLLRQASLRRRALALASDLFSTPPARFARPDR